MKLAGSTEIYKTVLQNTTSAQIDCKFSIFVRYKIQVRRLGALVKPFRIS